MNLLKKITLLSMVLGSLMAVTACSDDKAKSAGEKVDEVTTDMGNAIEDAGEKVDEMATDAGNAIEDTCEDVKEGLDAEDKDC